MLRRSTALPSVDVKRVGASMGTALRVGWEKMRWVAVERGASSDESGDVVAMILLPAAIDWRSSNNGSSVAAMLLRFAVRKSIRFGEWSKSRLNCARMQRFSTGSRVWE